MPFGKGHFFIIVGNYKFQVDFRYYDGMAFVARWSRPAGGYWNDEPDLRWERTKVKRRGPKPAAEVPRNKAPMESGAFHEFVQLLEHAAVTRYDDGGARQAGSFTVSTQDDEWRIKVNDPDSGCSFTVKAPTFDAACESACVLLSGDDCPWEEDRFLQSRKAPKRKK